MNLRWTFSGQFYDSLNSLISQFVKTWFGIFWTRKVCEEKTQKCFMLKYTHTLGYPRIITPGNFKPSSLLLLSMCFWIFFFSYYSVCKPRP